MIDIHTHLLPDFDDGPKNVEQTRKMLAIAENDGTTAVVVTPHLLDLTDYEREEEILSKFEEVKNIIQQDGLNVKAYLGGELYLFPEIKFDRVFSTINNNNKYPLVEFGMRQVPEFVPKKLFDFLMEGYVPILAHPERYLPIIKNPRYAFKFAQMGVALQMNAGSILGVFGESVQQVAHQLLDHKCIHFIASDGHNTNSRTISLAVVKEYMTKIYGKETAEILLIKNPQNAISGKKLIREDPIPFENLDSNLSIWQKFKKRFKLNKLL
jgi:protein-tyrosine phosphatase